MKRTIDWQFPLPRTHTGALLGNATFGAMIWGQSRTLRITLGRADLWDHRGGMTWTKKHSFKNIRRLLESGDEKGMLRLFEEPRAPDGSPSRPSIVPLGRIDLELARPLTLRGARLDLGTGQLRISAGTREDQRMFCAVVDPRRPELILQGLRSSDISGMTTMPAWKTAGDALAGRGFPPPCAFDEDGISGWIQEFPADPAVAVAIRHCRSTLHIRSARGKTSGAAKGVACRGVSATERRVAVNIQARSRKWWRSYWDSTPEISIPDADLDLLYHYGMYKFGIVSNPKGTPATLQGPWIEEYQLPPWKSDYHFNINVQMCYWPAFHGNHLEHLLPLFDMVESWLPQLRHNAKLFIGIDDGLMLPHAVDDRGTCMGGFWTGTIDHGCTAWVAQMMYRYAQYSGDRAFLARRAYPFMLGAMRVFEEMLEHGENGNLELPISVSPEYRGASMNAWGRNASFQLACIHRLAEDLLSASKALGKRARPIWRRILKSLPRACLTGRRGRREIALWERTHLEESHRHHSHLAGITPFDVFDLDDPAERRIIENSLERWVLMGPGLWSGWCVPWASMIHTRVGNADAACLWLEIWRRVFTNEGRGTLHDFDFPGFTMMGGAVRPEPGEIMQLEAGLACVAAIQEMLVHEQRGVVHLFRGAPRRWRNAGFKGMLVGGPFLISARRRNARVEQVEITSRGGTEFRVRNPWGDSAVATIHRQSRTESIEGKVLTVRVRRGETVLIRGRARSSREKVSDENL